MNKVISLVFCLAMLILTSCNKSQEVDSASSKLVVGTSADNPPYEFISDGEIVGFDIDLIKEIAKELNRELIIKNLDFSGLLASLLSKNVDIVAAALTVTEERLKNVDFSNPYTEAEMAILFRDDSDLQNETDFADKIIGAQFGTTWEHYAKKLKENSTKGHIKSLENNLALVQELLNKNVDIVIMENLQVAKFVKKYPTLKARDLFETKSSFALALPKNSDLTGKVNEIIQKLEENGTISSIKAKWLEQ